MKGKAEIQLQDLLELKDYETMFRALNNDEYIFRNADGEIERLMCLKKDEKYELLSKRNLELFHNLQESNDKFFRAKHEIRDSQNDLSYYQKKSNTFETELYHLRNENKRIRGVRKFDKTFAIVGLVSCAFGVAFLINYLIRLV